MRTKTWLSIFILAVFVTAALLGSRLLISEQRQYADQQRYQALAEMNSLATEIDSAFQAQLAVLRTLQAQLSLNPDLSHDELRRISRFLLQDNLAIEHLAFAPDLTIAYVYPEDRQASVIGFEYADDPVQYASVRQAVTRQEMVIDGPVELIQGGTAMIARAPVFRSDNGELWGIISQVINYPQLLADTSIAEFERLDISLTRNTSAGEQQSLWGDASGLADAEQRVSSEIPLPYGHMQLVATPASGDWATLGRNWTPYWLTMGLLVFLLTGLASWAAWSQYRLREAFTVITRQAHFDSLTGLLNRESFHQQLTREIAEQKTTATGFALLFVDLDHFKDINDSHGHHTGDALLQVIARRLLRCVRTADSVARLGGDEFIILLREATHSQALHHKAREIQQSLCQPIRLGSTELLTHSSVGIAVCPDDGDSAEELMRAADLAMYAAKAAGRGRYHFHNQLLREEADTHNKLYDELERALTRDELELWYQPILNAQTGQLVALEALIRWRHPREGLVNPGYFIPTAEKTGLIRRLGLFTLQQACTDYQRLQTAGITPRLSLNFSPAELQDAQLVQEWFTILERAAVDPKRFTFEITESMLMPQREHQRELLHDISAYGITLAVDDFGTGYSSAHYLRTFPVGLLKIDRSFIQQVPDCEAHTDLLRALLQMARALHLQVIVEGVELQSQLDFLVGLQVEYVQGFYFARPQPLADIIKNYQPQQFQQRGFGVSQ